MRCKRDVANVFLVIVTIVLSLILLYPVLSPSLAATMALLASHDVFVSFRGEDTRTNFTDHLFAALERKGIRAYRDDYDLERGETIWKELDKAIERSRVAVIVFSKNYACSKWCLKELVKIMECRTKLKQKVLPVFYLVSASEVRAPKSLPEGRGNELKTWRFALTDAANVAGLALKPDR